MVKHKRFALLLLIPGLMSVFFGVFSYAGSFDKKKQQYINTAWLKIFNAYVTNKFFITNTGYNNEDIYYRDLAGPDWTADVGMDLGAALIIGDRFILHFNELPAYSFHSSLNEKKKMTNLFQLTVLTYLGNLDVIYKTIFSKQRERPTSEFLQSVLRKKRNHSLLLEYKLGKRFFFNANFIYETSSFSDDKYLELYDLTSLNQDTMFVRFALKRQIFTRTELKWEYEYFKNNFSYDINKNGHGAKYLMGIIFPQQGDLNGSFDFGIKTYTPRNPEFRSFTQFTGTGSITFALMHRLQVSLGYQVDTNFTYWDVNQYYQGKSLEGGLAYLFGPKTQVALRYYYADLTFKELGGQLQTRKDIDRRATFTVDFRPRKKITVGLSTIYFKKQSSEILFEREYLFIGGQLFYEF